MGEAPGRGRLEGRRLLVVGGGQRVVDAATDPIGNGRAISLLCGREGAHVAVADRNEDSAQDTVEMIRKESGRAFTISADITDEEHVARMIDEARIGLGGLDGLVLNVGIGAGALGLAGVKVDDWDVDARDQLARPDAVLPSGAPRLGRGGVDRVHLVDRGHHVRVAAARVRRLEGGARRPHAPRRGGGRVRVASGRTSSPPVSSTRHSGGSRAPAGPHGRVPECRSVVRRPRGRSPTRSCSSSLTRACTSPVRPSRSTVALQACEARPHWPVTSSLVGTTPIRPA